MQKIIVGLLTLFVLVSCKSKQSVTEASANEELAAMKVIQNHYANAHDFASLYIRANAKYQDGKQTHNVAAEIRIKKDEIIWINVKLFGIPVAKALITPDKVSYYEKINGTYFEGNFDLLSSWLGTNLDFHKVQNLFIGNAIDDLTKTTYTAAIENDLYKLTEKRRGETDKAFYFEAANFLIKKEWIAQASENRSLEIEYPSHGKYGNSFMPNSIKIIATQEHQTLIDLVYKNITFDENLNYSFSIPDGYEQVTIDK
jgi:hypothetical protein